MAWGAQHFLYIWQVKELGVLAQKLALRGNHLQNFPFSGYEFGLKKIAYFGKFPGNAGESLLFKKDYSRTT